MNNTQFSACILSILFYIFCIKMSRMRMVCCLFRTNFIPARKIPGGNGSQPFYTIFVLRQLKLPGIKLIIFAFLPKQIIVVAALNDAAVFQHHDCIGVAHG